MNRILYTFLMVLAATLGMQAQTLSDLESQRASLLEKQNASKAVVDELQAEIDALNKQIDILSPWQTGLSGLIGLNFGGSNNWQANANRNSSFSALNLGINAFANNIKEKSFWRNTLNSNISWQGLDNNTKDDQAGTGFLADRNGDILIGSSLYGYRLNQDFAVSALGDLNTSVFNFLKPGTFDIGIGGTWTPHQIPNLVVVVHPLTYHFAFSAFDAVESQAALGAKVKATYQHTFPGGITWSSNLGAFVPYTSEKFPVNYLDEAGNPQSSEEGLFEYTWINSINVADIWKGVGLGLTFGLRGADFEYPPGLQTYSAVGLTYGF